MSSVLSCWQASHAVRTSAGGKGDDSLYGGDSYDFDFIGSASMRRLQSDSYGLLSARISYIPDNADWSVAIWGNNLTDEEYYNEVTANGFALTGNLAPPITYGIDLTYSF